MRELTLRLPYPPTVNTYWRHTVKNRKPVVYVTEQGKQYRHNVRISCYQQAPDGEPMTGRLKVFIDLSPPDRRKRDIDNVLKALLDALTAAGVYQDDSQIDCLTIRRAHQVTHGAVHIEIKEAG